MKETYIIAGEYKLLPQSERWAIPGMPRRYWEIREREQQPRRPLRVRYDWRNRRFRAWR